GKVVDPQVDRLRQVAYDELAPTVRLPWVESGFVIEPQRQARLGPLARLVLLLPRGQRGAEAAFDEQMVKDVRAMTALAVLVHRGKRSRRLEPAGVEVPTEVALGLAIASIVGTRGVPAEPFALLRLALPGDEQREQGFPFIDRLPHRQRDILAAAQPQRYRAGRSKQQDRVIERLPRGQRPQLRAFDETL